MRTLMVLVASLVLATGCATPAQVRRDNGDVLAPKTHKPVPPKQHRAAHQRDGSKAVAGQTRIEGVLTR